MLQRVAQRGALCRWHQNAAGAYQHRAGDRHLGAIYLAYALDTAARTRAYMAGKRVENRRFTIASTASCLRVAT